MRRAALVLAAVAALSGCGGTATETVTSTETVTRTETTAAADPSLPAPVSETRAALLEAAGTGDYEQLRPLVPDGLHYSFGETKPGGAVDHWIEIDEETDDSPIQILAGLLQLPHAYFQGLYVWPFAFPYASADLLTDEDRQLLSDVGGTDLSDRFLDGAGYAGWRAGIDDDGAWLYFIAGD